MAGKNTTPNDPPRSDLPRKDRFGLFANTCSTYVGSRWAFIFAVGVIVVWAVTGPIYHYSDTWQLIINTGTTIVTFLMVFLIQNTQNRDARAINLKLNELIESIKSARNEMIDIEHLSDAELDVLAHRYEAVRKRAEERGLTQPEGASRN
ncbi:MAG TPA: low affinity iron permease family protein [Edaphobacter sp.]|nr:low affinity iron permease family protein [Edaphobacter sp.]